MTALKRLTDFGRRPQGLLRSLPARISGVMLLGITLLVSMATSAEAALPKARCDLANAAAPVGDLVVGNILGFADKYGPYMILGAVALFVLTAFTRHSNKYAGAAFKVAIGLLVLSVIGTIIGKLFSSAC